MHSDGELNMFDAQISAHFEGRACCMFEQKFDDILTAINMPARVQHTAEREGARVKHTFTAEWSADDAMACKTPEMELELSRPIIDIQYQWHSGCGTDRSLKADWCAPTHSKISSGCPVTCFYSDDGTNRLTVALDDCVTLISRQMGVREEDATLSIKIKIPLDATGKLESYSVTLWLDETACRYEDAIRAVNAWWEQKYESMPVPKAARMPMYSCWYSFHQSVYAHEVEAECARAKALGMDTVIVDDGWQTDDNSRGYAYCGDWQPTPGKIPDMRAHVKAVHDLGMKYMLWYSVPFIGKYSEAAKLFKGKTLEYQERMGAYTLDPRYPEVRQYLIDTYVRALKEWDLDGFKLDFIDSFRMRPDTPAWREGMDYVVLEDAVRRLMIDVMKALRAIKDDILIEFRQSYMGPVMREFGNMMRVGDCPNSTSTNRVGMVDLRLTSGNTAVHSDMLVWNVNDSVECAVDQIENVLFSTVQVSVLLDRVPEKHISALKFWLDFMRRENHLLTEVPLYAEAPQMLYPQVSAIEDGRGVIAGYLSGYCVKLPASKLRECYVVNANSGNELMLKADSAANWNIEVMDCTGAHVRTERVSISGITAISVPAYGLIHMTRE